MLFRDATAVLQQDVMPNNVFGGVLSPSEAAHSPEKEREEMEKMVMESRVFRLKIFNSNVICTSKPVDRLLYLPFRVKTSPSDGKNIVTM